MKAILRTMTAKTGAERGQKETEHKKSLKSALADVLQKNKPEEQSIAAPSAAPRGNPPKPVQEEKKPFEVSEDVLKKVLKGES